MTATLTAPRTTDRFAALHTLRNADLAAPGRVEAALESLGRKAGIEAAEHRLRCYGAEWTANDREWRSRDAVKAVRDLERAIGRELADDERGLFVVTMIDLMYDLV